MADYQHRLIMKERPLKIVYLTPALYMAGGVERVLTLKANYFVEHYGYDITIILTEGKDKPLFYPLSDKIKVINLGLNFEEIWNGSLLRKLFLYIPKQRQFKKLVTEELMRLRPDITISMLRREINFVTGIKDGSRKIGELHVNRANYRNFTSRNPIKIIIQHFWTASLVSNLRKLDRLVVLTEKDREAWVELDNVVAIPNPLVEMNDHIKTSREKRVIAVGRYSHEKGYDKLLMAWVIVQNKCPDWKLEIFGDGDKTKYEALLDEMHIDKNRCVLHGRTSDVQKEYDKSSLAVCSSSFEGFGMTILEAMSCGLPVVSFDCPWGPQSIISDGEDGILVENGNVVKLASALVSLMKNDSLRHAMSIAAKKNTPWFNIDYIAKMWKTLFEEVVKRNQI